MSIGSKLEELIFDRDISQKQMADDLNLSPSTLNNYIRDYREPDISTIKILANYFGVTVDYLIEYQPQNTENFNGSLNSNEKELLSIFRCLKLEQQEFLLEQTKIFIKLNCKKEKPLSDTTLKTGIGNNK